MLIKPFRRWLKFVESIHFYIIFESGNAGLARFERPDGTAASGAEVVSFFAAWALVGLLLALDALGVLATAWLGFTLFKMVV